MSSTINLLPWREKAHKQKAIHFLYQLLLVLILLIVSYVALLDFKEGIQQKNYQIQTNLSQLQQQLQQGQSSLHSLRQNYISAEKELVSSKTLQQVFQLLIDLPLQQGELTSLSLDAKKLLLTGAVEHQQEFEQVHQALNQSNLFSKISLLQFQPEQQQIVFEIELLFEN